MRTIYVLMCGTRPQSAYRAKEVAVESKYISDENCQEKHVVVEVRYYG